MRFFLNNRNNEVQVRVMPQLQLTKDETFDSFQVCLKANSESQPYAPCQPFIIESDNGDVFNFVIASDKVVKIAQDRDLYMHELQLTQNINLLDMMLIRNNVFSQPYNNKIKGYYSNSCAKEYVNGFYDYREMPSSLDGKGQVWIENIIIPKNAKIKSAKMIVKRYNVGTDQTITKKEGTFDSIYRLYLKGDSSNYRYEIGLSNNTPLNKWIPIPDYVIGIGESLTFKEFLEANENEGTITITDLSGAGTGEVHNFGRLYLEADDESPLVCNLQVEFELEYYYYSAYDILNELLKQREAKGLESPFILPSEENNKELYVLLKRTITPNMTFTQSTLFGALKDVFSLFDAIFTIGEDKVLGIEYYNERNEKEVNTDTISGVSISRSFNKYTEGVVSYYQNAIQQIEYPKNGFVSLRNETLGVDTNNMSLITPTLIDYVNKLELLVEGKSGGAVGRVPAFDPSVGSIPVYGKIVLDITPYILEQSRYAVLDVTTVFPLNRYYTNLTQSNAIYYNRNSKSINISSVIYQDYFGRQTNTIQNVLNTAWHRFFGFSDDSSDFTNNNIAPPNIDNDWKSYKMRIEYSSVLNGRTKVESIENKFKGETIANQSEGRINLNKLGLNVLGLTMKMGQPILTLTHKISSFEDRVNKGDWFEDENGSLWVANICTYTIIDNDHIQGNIEFTKNFNSLAMRTIIDNDKRLSNISNELATVCEDDKVEYIYFSQNYPGVGVARSLSICGSSLFRNLMKETLFPKGEITSPNAALFTAKEEDGTVITFGKNNERVEHIYIPLVKYGYGNALCYEMMFDSPISAGKQTSISQNWYGSKYYTIEFLYADDEGWVDKVDISFCNIDDYLGQEFPKITTYTPTGSILNYGYYKKPNEIFALNYELMCLPREDRVNMDFIGSAFINNNAFVKDRIGEKTYLHYETDNNFKYSVLDRYGSGNNVVEITLESVGGTSYTALVRINTGLTEKPYAWAICNEEGEILLASNECVNFNEENGVMYFYLFTTKERL